MEVIEIDLKINKIKDLEKKYMDIIWEIITSERFEKELENIELDVNKNYQFIDKNYQIKNKIQVSAERLLELYIIKNIDIKSVYPSPISSDFSYYTEDCLLNIDSKTIDTHSNEGDDRYVQFGPHQVSFTNSNFYSQKIGNINFEGVTLPGGIPKESEDGKLPSLTFFIGITYNDNGLNFKIVHLKLSCIPNGYIVKKEFNNNIISNFKTYKYISNDLAKKLGNKYFPKEQLDPKWIPFKLSDKNSDKCDTWLDLDLPDLINIKPYSIWRFVDKKYKICIRADTARIKPEVLEKRKDSLGNNWIGIRKVLFNSSEI